jgi:hypothetical protein
LPLAVNALYRRTLNESREARPASPAELLSELTLLVENLEKASFDFPPAPPAEGMAGEVPPLVREPIPPPVPPEPPTDQAGFPSEQELEAANPPPSASPRVAPRPEPAWTGELPEIDRPLAPPYRSRDGREGREGREGRDRRRKRDKRSRSLMVLLVLALVGLGLGAAGGWLLLERLRARATPAPPDREAAGSEVREPVRRRTVEPAPEPPPAPKRRVRLGKKGPAT